MGGRGQSSMGGGFGVPDNGDEITKFAKMSNLDGRSRSFNPNGIEIKNHEEKARANAAIVRFIATNKPGVGEVLYIPVESDPRGGAYRYTVKVLGTNPYEYRIIGKVRIKNGAW